jgi:hypothetical protein
VAGRVYDEPHPWTSQALLLQCSSMADSSYEQAAAGDEREPSPVACSACFNDRGLRLDAERIGFNEAHACPNCGAAEGKKLSRESIGDLAYRFFVWGSFWRGEFGAAPRIQFNEHQQTSINVSQWLVSDVKIFERLLDIGFFHYGPRLWMVGEVEPLKALQKFGERKRVVDRIIRDYPTINIGRERSFYRIRKNPRIPSNAAEYDSPINITHVRKKGRLDSPWRPALYASPDLEVCVHECRVTAEDDIYVATLAPSNSLRLVDLTVLLKEEHVTEFESLDMAIHMLFLAGSHAYKITRAIANAARNAGFDGIIYPSYFSLLRLGAMPFQTVYGISHRRIPSYQDYEQAKTIPNLAIFGRPIQQGKIAVQCINKLIIDRVAYDFHFGPVAY